MAGISVVTEAVDDAVSFSETVEYLRLDEQVDTRVIKNLILASTNFVENYTGRALINRTLKMSIDNVEEIDVPLWEGTRIGPDITIRKRYIELPRPPVSSVSSVKYYDDSDTESTFASSKYYVDTQREPARIILRNGESFPTALRVGNAVEITYIAGYGATGASVPEALRLAMLQYITFNYEHRGELETGNPRLPQSLKNLLNPYRTVAFSSSPFGVNGRYL